MYEEALDTIQKESQLLTQENKQIKEKLTQQETQKDNNSFSIPISKTTSGQVFSSLSPELISGEIVSLKSALQHLREENTYLKGLQVSFQLQPIPEKVPTEKKTPPTSDVLRYSREITQLTKEVQIRRATPQVVDLSKSSSISPVQQLQSQKLSTEMIHNRIESLRQLLHDKGAKAIPVSNQSNDNNNTTKRPGKPLGLVKFPHSKPVRTQAILSGTQFEQMHCVFVQ